MQPDTSAAWQHALAQAVRHGTSPDPERFPPERLAVYARLVRNNIFGFVNRCFTETRSYCDETEWAQLLERFVREGEAHTPYFQEIAAEFFRFCQHTQALPEALLALMDLELAQLAAEVAVSDGLHPVTDAENSPLTLSSTAHLRHYPESHAGFFRPDGLAAAGAVLVWRDSSDDVRWCSLSQADHILLGLAADTPQSLRTILTQLADIMPPDGAWQQTLTNNWQHWINEGVLQAV